MLSVRKITGIIYFLLGLFMIICIGGLLLLQLLGVICGIILCFRGLSLMRPMQPQQSFFTFFRQDRFF